MAVSSAECRTAIVIVTPEKWHGNVFGHICLSVCLSAMRKLSKDMMLKVHFWSADTPDIIRPIASSPVRR